MNKESLTSFTASMFGCLVVLLISTTYTIDCLWFSWRSSHDISWSFLAALFEWLCVFIGVSTRQVNLLAVSYSQLGLCEDCCCMTLHLFGGGGETVWRRLIKRNGPINDTWSKLTQNLNKNKTPKSHLATLVKLYNIHHQVTADAIEQIAKLRHLWEINNSRNVILFFFSLNSTVNRSLSLTNANYVFTFLNALSYI